MAEAVLIDVANGLQTAIAAHDFGLEFESEMNYADVTRELIDLKKLHIDVVPFRRMSSTFNARGVIEYECAIDVIAREKFEVPSQESETGKIAKEDINRLVKLNEDIELFIIEHVKSLSLSSTNWVAQLRRTEPKLDYDRKMLSVLFQFTSWLRVYYLANKPLAT